MKFQVRLIIHAIDGGIADEVINLDDISKNIESEQLAKAAEQAKGKCT